MPEEQKAEPVAAVEAVSTEQSKAVEAIAKKVVINPEENPQGFVEALQSGAAKRVAYQALNYIHQVTGKEDKPPGNEQKQSVSPKDFMSYLKDGNVLAQFANALQPGAVPEPAPAAEAPAAEAPAADAPAADAENKDEKKEEKKEEPTVVNAALDKIKGFLDFAKKNNVAAADNVKAEDVSAGKPSAFQGMLTTLLGVGSQATSKFSKQGIDTAQLTNIVQTYVHKGFLQQLLALKDRLFKRQPTVGDKKTEAAEVKAEAVDDTAAQAQEAQ